MDLNNIVIILALVISSASVLAAAIAPLTATKIDDKVAGWLSKIKKVLDAVALNFKK